MSGSTSQAPYLRVQRNFPNDSIQALTVELDRSYVDIASKVNSRIIGTFALGNQVVTGEKYYFTGQPNGQQGLRQVYTFAAAGSIPHGINFATITAFPHIYGGFTNGTNWYPLPYVDVVSATNQVSVVVTPTNIVITAGGGTPPAITFGVVILEWISQF